MELPWHLRMPLDHEVLRVGGDFAVDEAGGVAIREVQRVTHSFKAAEIARRARAVGWTDLELLDALEWGVWDHSPGTPRVCIFARPLKGAVAHTGVL